MKPTLRKIAPYCLFIALIALIAAGGLFIVFKTFNSYVQVALAIVVLGLAAWVFLDPNHVRQIF